MIIECKGIFEWYFCVGNQTLIVKSEFYYVPDCKVLLIIPHWLFKSSTRTTGELIYNGDHAQLKIWDHPVLKIDYDFKNHLPTATARNAVIDLPIINMCITDGENKNLSPLATTS